MKATFLLLASVLSTISLSGVQSDNVSKSKRVSLASLPPAVRKTIDEQCKGGKIRTVVKEVENGKTTYEAELIVNGRSRNALIDETGATLEIEEEIPVMELPVQVKAVAEKVGKIIKAELVTKDGKVCFYEIDVKTSGKKSEIKIAPDGAQIKE